jgi:hypothetical protein
MSEVVFGDDRQFSDIVEGGDVREMDAVVVIPSPIKRGTCIRVLEYGFKHRFLNRT